MRTYSEKELLKAVEYACGQQKFIDYQVAGDHLIVEDNELKGNVSVLLDELCNIENNTAKDISLEDLHEYIDKP